MSITQKVFAWLPDSARQSLRRRRYARQIVRGTFRTHEPEYDRLSEWVFDGDWCLDVGANVGHYTLRLSELVGSGRVIAFEPMPATFELLATNSAGRSNITLVNAAVSNRTSLARMSTPCYDGTSLANYYKSTISDNGDVPVLCVAPDDWALPRISLIKIDAERHDEVALQGMRKIIERDRPLLIVESLHEDSLLHGLGYSVERLKGSPNVVLQP